MVTCQPHGQTYPKQTHYSFQLSGLQAHGKAEIRQATDSLLRTIAVSLGLSAHLIKLKLVMHAPSLPPVEMTGTFNPIFDAAATRSTGFQVNLAIACMQCTFVQRRLRLLGQRAKFFDAALAQGICAERCQPLPGAPSRGDQLELPSCLLSCPEKQTPLRTLYHKEPIIEARHKL